MTQCPNNIVPRNTFCFISLCYEDFVKTHQEKMSIFLLIYCLYIIFSFHRLNLIGKGLENMIQGLNIDHPQ